MTTTHQYPHSGGRQRGSVALELVILAPALLLFIGLVIFAGRTALAHQSIDHAASEAARTASLARTAGDANRQATDATRQTLTEQGLDCTSTGVVVDTAGFAAPVGTAATVTATVTCTVRTADLSFPGIPGSRTVTATAVSPLDTYRER